MSWADWPGGFTLWRIKHWYQLRQCARLGHDYPPRPERDGPGWDLGSGWAFRPGGNCRRCGKLPPDTFRFRGVNW